MWREKPDDMIGSHIHVRRDSNDGKGMRTWKWEADIDSFDPLTPGSTLSTSATQKNNKWTAKEKETIRIEERKIIDAPILGKVDAVLVSNHRVMTAQFNKWSYESKFEMWVAIKEGIAIKCTYSDNKGVMDCVLTELDVK